MLCIFGWLTTHGNNWCCRLYIFIRSQKPRHVRDRSQLEITVSPIGQVDVGAVLHLRQVDEEVQHNRPHQDGSWGQLFALTLPISHFLVLLLFFSPFLLSLVSLTFPSFSLFIFFIWLSLSLYLPMFFIVCLPFSLLLYGLLGLSLSFSFIPFIFSPA